MDEKKKKVIFNKAGGNASKNAVGAKISIPKPWLNKMNITEDERDVVMIFKDNKIIIEKSRDE